MCIICPYCGHIEIPEVGFTLPHTCAGKRREIKKIQKRLKAAAKRQLSREKELLDKAHFLMQLGILNEREALELADYNDEEENYDSDC